MPLLVLVFALSYAAGHVAAVSLAQYLLLTVVATALGPTAGALAAPELADPGAGLLNTVSGPTTDTAVAAVLLAVLVSLAGMLGPVVRAVRSSTAHFLADSARLSTHHPRLNAKTAYLPTALLVGIRLLVGRPGRAVPTAIGTATTSLLITAAQAGGGHAEWTARACLVSPPALAPRPAAP